MPKNIDDICLIIQCRAASQRIPEKMLKDFSGSGTTLTDIAIQKALQSKIPRNNIVFSAFDERLKNIARGYSLRLYHRTKRSEYSEGERIKELYEWHDYLSFKYGILLNACLPLLEVSTIDNFIDAFMASPSDGMFGTTIKRNYYWTRSGEMINKWPPNREVLDTKVNSLLGEVQEAGHFLYGFRMDRITKDNVFMGDWKKPGDIELFPVEHGIQFVDVDWPEDWEMARVLWKNRNMSEGE